MPRMGAGWGKGSGWFPAFILALGTCAGAVLALTIVLLGARDDASLGTTDPASAVDDSATRDLTYAGPLPASLANAGLKPGTDESKVDFLFEYSSAPGATPVRYFVPVVSLATALDSVTAAQLRGLLDGSSTFADVGGRGAEAVHLALTEGESPALTTFGPPADHVLLQSYPPLVEQMAARNDAIAFVPLSAVGPSVTALEVDGIDPVRGVGDISLWPFVERVTVTARTKRAREGLPALLAQLTPEVPAPVRVVATGDILQSRCSLAKIEATGDWGAALRGPVGEYLAAADLAIASLDGSIQDIGEPYRCVSTTNLTSPPQVMEALVLAGIDEVTVATNHVFDCGRTFCGERAFLRTLELLDQAGIKHSGGGRNLEEALAPVIIERGGIRFGILGFDDVAAYELGATATAPGTAPLDDSYAEENAAGEPAFFRPASELGLERFSAMIRSLKQQVDVVIVQVQTGTEDTHDPSPRSIKALRAAADAGADLVIGNQAHHVQAVEARGRSYIAYALGNFIFDQVWTPEHTQGYLVEVTFHGKRLANVRLLPYHIVDQYRPTFVDGQLRAKILDDVFTASEQLPSTE